MTDDSKSAKEEAVSSSAQNVSGPPKPLRIKIGSQREGRAAPADAEDGEAITEAAATQNEAAATQSEAAATPNPEPSREPQVDEPDVSVVDEPAAPAESPPVVDDDKPRYPPPRPTRISDELSQEIAEALGDVSLESLMDGSAAGSETARDIELDQRYSATVIKTDRESVFFDLGGQYQGLASLKQFDEDVPTPGTSMEVVPTRFVAEDNLYEVVVPGASVEVQDWSDLSEGVVVEARITGHNKGGLECEVNRIRGFIPISQVSLFRVEDLEPYVGQALKCVVTEVNPQRRNLVLSHRAVLEREQAEAREILLNQLEVGQIREGVVRRVLDFGAFVDLGGVDGMVHVSQLSWDRVSHPSEVLQEGQTVKVRIEKIDPDSGKIGLSYRDLLDHPWQDAETKFPVGAILDGTISKIMPFGAFVRIAPGLEGLVHISELAHHHVQRVNSVVKEGEPVKVKVLSVDAEEQKMSLSIKAVSAGPQTEADAAEDDEPESDSLPPRKSTKPLKGGINRPSGGEQFGLNW